MKLVPALALLLAACSKPVPPAPVAVASPTSSPAVVPSTPPVPTKTPVEPPAPPPKPKFERKVAVKVESSTWRENEQPFDIASDIAGDLATQLIDVVTEGAEATIDITWVEREGKSYRNSNREDEEGEPSTNITYEFKLTDPAGKTLLKFEVASDLGQTVHASSLYQAALNSVQNHPSYQQAAVFVSAALGNKTARQHLFALATVERDEIAAALIEQLGVKPETPEAQAFAAIGAGDFDACVRIGKPAVEPLRSHLQNRYYDKAPLLKALLAIGDEGNGDLFREMLKRGNGSGEPEDAIFLIGALEKIDDGRAIPDLERIAKAKSTEEGEEPVDPQILKAAKKAIETIKARTKK